MNLNTAYNPSYLCVQDILASHIRVPCVTKVNLPHFGFLDPSQSSEDLPAESKVEIPFWAVKTLVQRGRGYAVPEMPKLYKESYMQALKADPKVVDLNKMGPHFYQSGLHLTSLPVREAEDVAETLPKLLQHRLREVTDTLSYETKQVTLDDDPLSKRGNGIKPNHLDAMEQRLYQDARKAESDLCNWLEKK